MLSSDLLPSIERGGPVPHLSLPHRDIVAWMEQEQGETIREFVDRQGLEDGPPIVVYELDDDGEPKAILRAEWYRPLAEVRPLFVSCPMGGGGGGGGSGSVLAVVGMIALMAMASFVPGALGLTGIMANLVSATILVGGGLLISHFMRPKAPAAPAPTYDFALGNNSAKPGQPIPVHYGRLKFMPDFSDAPWSDYSGLDQIYHSLLCLGVGEYDIEEIGVNTTPIWTAAEGFAGGFGGVVSGAVQAHSGVTGDVQGVGGDVQFQVIGPGGTVTLFPSNIAASPDVSGQQLPEPYGTVTNGVTKIGPDGETSGPDKVGPFVINSAGTIARAIAIDLSWPSGMYHIGSNNSYRVGSVRIVCEYQYVDDQGHATGDWGTLFDKTWTFMSKSPWRESVKTTIAPGRVQVRLFRMYALDKDGQSGVNWIGARAYCDGPTARPNVTQLAIQAKADKLLSGYSSQRLYVIATRRIPVWDAGTASWVMRATRNWVWAMCDRWADPLTGGGQSRNKLDIPTLSALAASADARGDYFDHRFTRRGTLIEDMTICAQAGLAQPLPLWDTLSAVRDERRSLPRMVLTDFEIIRGSLKITHRLASANACDGVVGQYFDADTWAMQEVSSTGTVANLLAPNRVVLEGVTDRNQAYRNAIYLDRVNRYRRSIWSLEIEGEGKLLKRGDYVVVSTELPGTRGASYRIETFDLSHQATPNLTLHAAHDWSASGQRYIRIKGPSAQAFGPVKCGRFGADNVVVLDAADLATVQAQQGLQLFDMLARPVNGDGVVVAELPSAVISVGTPQEFQGLVHEIAAGAQDGNLRIDLAPYAADLVYADPTTPLTPLPAAPTLILPTVPGTITGLGASLTQDNGALTLTLNAMWQPDAGSDTYEPAFSTDDGVTWNGLPICATAQFSIGGFSGANLWLRVRGRRGNLTSVAWSQVYVVAPSLTVDLNNLGYVVQYDDLAPTLLENLGLDTQAKIDELIASTAFASADLQQQITEVKAQTGAAQASVKQTMTAVATAKEALASQITEVSAQTAAGLGYGAIRFVAVSNLDSGVSAAYDVQVSATGASGSFSSAGLRLEVKSDGTSRVVINAATFALANNASRTIPFLMSDDGTLTMQGVTYIASTIKSLATTSSGARKMQLDFVNGALQIARS
ncbi:hypothetical protein M2322_000854 [Rhodoblastus acidophilus]|uniref:DUF1983 domain-containing protein n=1 Tax=Rhodoblastus acidophilus TaxID=1074 RepID=UPI00222421CC|nr:DUF1983 domain-containing protein [Rhodoblastus acidophilus]MCW2315320.1 hypothetical protein [Rhodoblastus acidophilus]